MNERVRGAWHQGGGGLGQTCLDTLFVFDTFPKFVIRKIRYDSLHFVTFRYNSLHYDPLRSVTICYDSLRLVTLRYNSLQFVTLRLVTIRYDSLRLVTFRYTLLHFVTTRQKPLQNQLKKNLQ